jgi:hypothetical protein
MTPFLPSSPSARYTSMMTYDPVDGYVLLFGGFTTSAVGDTWIFQNGKWTDISGLQLNSPPSRYIGSMAYDPLDQYVLLFGGYSGSVTYSDTWSFTHGQWNQITSSVHTPTTRWRANMGFDVTDGYMVLFGGTDSSGATIYADTWYYLNGSWNDNTKNVTGNPPGTYRGSMAWDPGDGYLLMFGGCTSSSPSSGTTNTWSYVTNKWTNLATTDGTPPAARLYTQMTYDNATSSILLFGGSSTTSGPVYNDTWLFKTGKWYQDTANLTKSPPIRGYEMLAWIPQGQFLLMFGGYTTVSNYGDTWGLGPQVLTILSVTPAAIDLGLNATIHTAGFSNHRPLNISYPSLPTGCTGGNVTQLNCTPTAYGNFSVNVSVRDTMKNYGNMSVVLPVLQDPTLVSFLAVPSTVTASEPTILQPRIAGGGTPYHYQYTGMPPGCVSGNTSALTCRPTTAGTYRIHLVATDTRGFGVQANASLIVNPKGKVVSFLAAPADIDVNSTTAFQVSLQNGTPPFTYVYAGLPRGCLPANLAVLTCTPLTAGLYNVTVNVTDSSGYKLTALTMLIVNPPLAIIVFTISPALADVGQSIQFTVSATGGSGTIRYVYTNLPQGCTVTTGASGRCTPTGPGTSPVLVTTTDAVNGTANATATVTVRPDPVALAPVVHPVAVDANQIFTVQPLVQGGIAPYHFVFAGLPSGCALTASGNMSCTPASPGPLSVTVTVTDASGKRSTSPATTVRVDPDPGVASSSTAPNSPVVGKTATFTVVPKGGSGVYGYRYSGLPPGCTTANSSTITCTPSSTGTFQVTVLVKDSRGYTGSGFGWFNVSTPTSGTGFLGLTDPIGYVIVGVVAAAAVAGVALMLRRRRSAPTPEETPTA